MGVSRFAFFAATFSIAVACGGTAVIDAPMGAGGSGGTTTTTTPSGPCEAVTEAVQDAIDAVQSCSPYVNTIQCSGDTVVLDTCGCEVVANDQYSTVAPDVLAAYHAWVDTGCGPLDCDSCPPPPESPWYCDPTAERCMPAYE